MSKRKPPPLRPGLAKQIGCVILHEPTQVLAGQRPVRNDAHVTGPVADFPRLPDRHARRQRLVVKALQLAPAPDALFEDRPEGEGIEHASDLDSDALDSPVSQAGGRSSAPRAVSR